MLPDNFNPPAGVPAVFSPSPSRSSQLEAISMNKAGSFQAIQQIDEEAVRRFHEEGMRSDDG